MTERKQPSPYKAKVLDEDDISFASSSFVSHKDEPIIGNFLQPLEKGINEYDIDDLRSSQSSMQFVPRDAKRIAK
jgi:hypothetical protein